MNGMPGIELPVHTLVTLVFYVVLGGYAIFTGILYYHWRHFGTDQKITAYTLTSYFLITVPLILTMGILVLTI